MSITDGHRESTESWADVLRDLKRRGMRAPVLAVGDGALGFWGALSRGLPRDRPPAVLGPQDGERHERPAQVGPAGARRAALARSVTPRTETTPRRRLKRFVKDYEAKWPKAVEKIVEGRRRAAGLLRLPGRALGPPQDHQSDRVHLRHRPAAHQGDQGTGLAGGRTGHGLQADRVGPDPLAGGQRTAPRRAGPCRRRLREGGDGRTIRRAVTNEVAA